MRKLQIIVGSLVVVGCVGLVSDLLRTAAL